ncbi:FabD/lysophospholipase-like protein [Meredithblackwellia eburnea MCA 4105]
MERLWSGGEVSPPIPLEHYTVSRQLQRPKHILAFPGSGSQYVGMGHFLRRYPVAERTWDDAASALDGFESWRRGLRLSDKEGELGLLGRLLDEGSTARDKELPLKQVVFEGPQDQLTRSSNAQPAILITSIAFLRTLEEEYGTPVAREASYFLGHSSGEYSAAVASGAISFADGVRLTRLHGLLTSAALSLPSIGLSSSLDSAPSKLAQMSALVINPGHSHQEVADVIDAISHSRPRGLKGAEGSVEVASYNSSAQVVLAGSRDGILRASEVLRERGIASRAADLPVSAPFHCSFMKPAADGMQAALESLNLKAPTAPIVSGLDGTLITTPNSLISNLVAQISLPVRWSYCLATLRASEAERLIFLGPGKALANLARRDAVAARAEDTFDVQSVATDADLAVVRKLWEV